jgi:hypothetical protein
MKLDEFANNETIQQRVEKILLDDPGFRAGRKNDNIIKAWLMNPKLENISFFELNEIKNPLPERNKLVIFDINGKQFLLYRETADKITLLK